MRHWATDNPESQKDTPCSRLRPSRPKLAAPREESSPGHRRQPLSPQVSRGQLTAASHLDHSNANHLLFEYHPSSHHACLPALPSPPTTVCATRRQPRRPYSPHSPRRAIAAPEQRSPRRPWASASIHSAYSLAIPRPVQRSRSQSSKLKQGKEREREKKRCCQTVAIRLRHHRLASREAGHSTRNETKRIELN